LQGQPNALPSFQGGLGGIQSPNQGELLLTAEAQQQAIEIKRSEIIQLSFDSDSQTVRDVLMMVAPALDYNPRRIKQFINLFRLKVSIASLTGLFDQIEDIEGNVIQESLTFQQLGKFIAISLRWPLFLLELDNDPQLFKSFYNNRHNLNIGGINKSVLHSESRHWGREEDSKIFRYWLSQDKFRKLLVYGYQEYDQTSQAYTIYPKFSLAEVNVEKLLQVSPKVVRQNTNLDQQIQTPQVQITALPKGFNIEMVDIPAGKFLMGSDEFDTEKPIHEVTVKAFKMGKYPVTQAQYEAVMGTNPSRFTNNPNNPVEQISWFDAHAFCEKLNQLTVQNYRLPTEAEWEYACRAGTQTLYCFGDDESLLADYAWFDKNSDGKTHPVGEKLPNAWGLHDMHGNVWEWCADQWHENYADKPENFKQDGSATWLAINIANKLLMMLRGGSWLYDARYCRSADRSRYYADYRGYNYGFRLVLGPP